MSVLAIETATKQLGVAVLEQEQLLASYELLAEYPHAVELPHAVTSVLKAAHTTLDRVEAVIVDIGPGSFTGLRIGLAFVKALVFPTRTPVVGVPSLDVLAAHLPFVPEPICPLLDARQHNVYAALYRQDAGQLVRETDYLLGPVDGILAKVPARTIFLGDGCRLYRDRIRAQCPDAQFAEPELWLPRVATLGRLGYERFLQGSRDDPSRLVPLYLYPLDCSVRGPDRPTSVLPTAAAPTAS